MKTHWPHSDAFLTSTVLWMINGSKFVKTFIRTVGFAWINLMQIQPGVGNGLFTVAMFGLYNSSAQNLVLI